MTLPPSERVPHIVFLFSDTGGGHRSAAQAIIEALGVEFPEQYTWEMVDFFRYYAPPPFNTATDTYAPMAQIPDLWELGFVASNGRYRARMIQRVIWPFVKSAVNRLVADHPCDLMLSVHPIINTPLLRGLPKDRPRYMTVITDMVSTHQWWYEKKTDMLIVPTREAYDRGLALGVDPQKMHVVGLPIADKFTHLMSKSEARQALGLPADFPLALLVSGGEGMGPLEETINAIVAQKVPIGLVVIAGKNEALKAKLESQAFAYPAFIKGFVNNMADYMSACDVIITKAGPGTISESFIAGLPIILYLKMPGQEDGNVDYVVNHQAGLWLPDPQDVAETLKRWMADPEELARFRRNSAAQARPDSSRIIARTAMGLLGKYPLDSITYYD